jgi:hypothetical protein
MKERSQTLKQLQMKDLNTDVNEATKHVAVPPPLINYLLGT